MEITHELIIKQLDQLNDGSGTVKYICYELISSCQNKSVKLPGFIELDTENVSNFILYNDLTEQDILDWTYAYNSDKIEKQKLINEQNLNSILNLTPQFTIKQHLPWQPLPVKEEVVVEETQVPQEEEVVVEETQVPQEEVVVEETQVPQEEVVVEETQVPQEEVVVEETQVSE